MRQTIDKLATQILRFILPVTALVLPLFFLPLTTEFFIVNKNLVLLLAGSLALVAWLARNITRRRIHLSLTPAAIPFLLLSAIYLISSFVQSGSPYLALTGRTATVIALAALYIGVTSSQKNKLVIDLTLAALLLSAALASLFSLYSYSGLSAVLPGPAWLTSKTFSVIGGPIPFLTFVAPLIPVALYLAFSAGRWPTKAVLIFASLLFSAASLAQISLILPGSGNQIFILPVSVGWSIAVDIFKNAGSALLGTGPETFLSAFTRLKPLSLNQGALWDTRFTSSSNEFLTILTTVGLLGAFFWLLAFIQSIRLALTQIGAKKTAPDLIVGLILVCASLLANLLIPANPALLGLTFISLALLSLSLKLHTDLIKDISLNLTAVSLSETGNYTEVPETKTAPFQLLPWFAAILLLPLLGYFWIVQGRAYAANLATYKAMALLNTNATESYNQQIRAYNLDPYNPYYRVNFSQTSLALANTVASRPNLTDQDKSSITQLVQQAIREAKNATALDPANVLTWENLSSTYRQITNFAEGASDWAIASYGQAISLDPNNPRLHLELGGLFFALADYDSAGKLYERAIALKPNWANGHYNLAQVHKIKKENNRAIDQLRTALQLLEVDSEDYRKVQTEIEAVSQQTRAQAGEGTPGTVAREGLLPGGPSASPAPLPSVTPKVSLPEEAAPNLPN
ncbi:MAG: tetratricopeptide repeat protein [Patescibacteria group bacterium]